MQSKQVREIKEKLIEAALFGAASISVLTTAGIVFVLLGETLQFFQEVSLWDFLTDSQWTPLFVDKHFGIMSLLCGTLLITAIAMFVAVPCGLLSAIYLSEYSPKTFRSIVKPVLEILAGVPTVVYGYFALLFVTPLLQTFLPNLSGFNALGPGIVMGIMIIPMVSSLSEDAMQAVPKSLREGAYALGATKFQVSVRVVVPAALSGILSSLILAVSRAIGETMIVTIASGQQANLTLNPMVPIETITAYIVQVSLGDTPTGTLEYQTIFAAGTTLFLFTLMLNLLSQFLKDKYRQAYV